MHTIFPPTVIWFSRKKWVLFCCHMTLEGENGNLLIANAHGFWAGIKTTQNRGEKYFLIIRVLYQNMYLILTKIFNHLWDKSSHEYVHRYMVYFPKRAGKYKILSQVKNTFPSGEAARESIFHKGEYFISYPTAWGGIVFLYSPTRRTKLISRKNWSENVLTEKSIRSRVPHHPGSYHTPKIHTIPGA